MDEADAPVHHARGAFAARFFNQLYLYKNLLLRFWWIPVALLGLSLGIEMVMLKSAPPTFESVARMIVNVKLSIPNANVYSEELNNFYGTQVALMQSDSVVNRVRHSLETSHPDLHPVPVTIDVTLSPKTSIFYMKGVGRDASYTEAYLEATMEQYIQLKKELLSNATTATQSSMEEELDRLGVDLQASKQKLLDYQASNSVVFLQGNGGNNAADYLASLNRQLDDTRSELSMLQTQTLDQNLEQQQGIFMGQDHGTGTNSLMAGSPGQANTNSVFQNVLPSNLGPFEQSYLQAKQQIILLEASREELSELSPTSAQIIELNQQIAHQQKLMDIYKEQSMEELRNREHSLELKTNDLGMQIQEWEAKAMEVSKKLSDFEALKENTARLQTLYDAMQVNVQTLDVNKGIGQESVTILEAASPGMAVTPQASKHLVMAALIGLLLGAGILVLINQLDDRIQTYTELEQRFDIPVLGQIPLVKKEKEAADAAILKPDDDRYDLVEANRSLRSALLYRDYLKTHPASTPKCIVITSACPNDGKSMVSANFAITLAEAGAKVLLIDADLRRGVMHDHFPVADSTGMAEGPGLASVLTGECDWTQAVIQTSLTNLHILPRGKSLRNAGNLFAHIGKLVTGIKEHYDFCIFDTPPVLVADDVLSLAPNADGLIMVTRAGVTSGRLAQAALNMLHQRRVNILGMVLNAVPPKASGYYCYRYKEYY